MTAKKEISIQQVKIVEALEKIGQGTPRLISEVSGVNLGTTGHLLLSLTLIGLLERQEFFNSYLYRLSPQAGGNPYYVKLMATKTAMKS
jgi:hypothetical protein